MKIPTILKYKMIEMDQQDLMISGMAKIPAAASARKAGERYEQLHTRACIALGMKPIYDGAEQYEPQPAPDAFEVGIEAIRAANPGVDIQPAGSGAFTADTPSLIFPVTPPRPTRVITAPAGTSAEDLLEYATATKTLDRAAKRKTEYDRIRDGKTSDGRPWTTNDHVAAWNEVNKPSYEFPEHLKVGGSLFNEGNPADDPAGDCCESDSGPVPPSDVEVVATLPGLSRQDLEDKLRIIAAIVDQQPPFGTELADFRRRLRRML